MIAGTILFLHARRLEIATPGGDPLLLRAGNWAAAAEMIRDHPLLGTGPGSFGTYYPRYIRPGMNETRYAHNSYLQTLAGWGAWAALPILALLAAVRGRLREARRAGGEDLPALAAGAGFLAHNLIDFTAFLPGVAIPAALLIGIGVGEGVPGTSQPPRRPARALLAGLALAGLAAFVAQAAAGARSRRARRRSTGRSRHPWIGRAPRRGFVLRMRPRRRSWPSGSWRTAWATPG